VPDTDLTPATVFDSAARLQLLQLLARRQLAERLVKQTEATDAAAGDSDEEAERDEPSTATSVIPSKWRFLPDGFKLHEWQQDCLPKWLAAGKGTVKVATGGGKTLFALAAAEHLQNEQEPDLRLVIVVPTVPLMVQWKADLVRGNIPESAIAFMGGGLSPGLLVNVRVLVCVLNSAREKLAAVVKKAGWSERMLLVVDECHRAKAEHAKKIFRSEPRYTLGLSATPESADDDETLPATTAYNESEIGKVLGPILYELSLEQAHAAGLLSPFEVWHVGLELNNEERLRYTSISNEIGELRKELKRAHDASRSRQSFIAWCQTMASRKGGHRDKAEQFIGLANRRKRLLYQASARRAAVLGLLKDALTEPDARAIVFHEAVAEVDRLFLDAVGSGLPAVLEHSKLPGSLRTESIEAFREGTARAILSAKSLIEGFNVPSADVGVIAASTSSVRQRIQSLGRMLRRKQSNRTARIYVLYVSGTADEDIYAGANWEALVGAERNRYFAWKPAAEQPTWPDGLEETNTPPRTYLPPSSQVDVAELNAGDAYPGQSRGQDLHVDQAGNLRLADDTLLEVDRQVVDTILKYSQYRKAVRTPAGHVIVRDAAPEAGQRIYRYAGTLAELPDSASRRESFKVIAAGGRRQLIRANEGRSRTQSYARNAEKAKDPAAGAARESLLKWITECEAKGLPRVTEFYWDGSGTYWIEAEGRRIECPEKLAALEFAT